jgi:Domain of unknown function (DUF4157)
MGTFSSLQHQQRGSSAAPTSSLARPIHPFVPVSFLSSQLSTETISFVEHANIDHAPRFGYTFANIPLFPRVQRKAVLPSPLHAENQLSSRIRATRGRGHPLDEQTQQRLEQGTGMDLSGVRVHTDTEADRLSSSVNATAFTTGSDIFFRSGAYNPHSSRGFHTLAHEVTHVVQQATGPVSGTHTIGGVSISDHNDRFEQAAEANASRLAVLTVEKDATPGPKQPAPIHRSAASQLLALQRLVFLAGDISTVYNYFQRNDITSIVTGGNIAKIGELQEMLALNAHVDWSLKRAGGPLQDLSSIDLSSLRKSELFYIVEHGGIGAIGSMGIKGKQLGQMLVKGKLPEDFAGTIMITSCYAGATDAAHPKSLVEKVADELQKAGRKRSITIKGAIGTTITTHGAVQGALSTGFQVVKDPTGADKAKAAMMHELLAELGKSGFTKGPSWWPTAPADIVNLEKAKPTELAEAKKRAAANGTSPEIEFVIGFAEKSSEMFKKIQQENLARIAPHLYTTAEEVVNNVITTVITKGLVDEDLRRRFGDRITEKLIMELTERNDIQTLENIISSPYYPLTQWDPEAWTLFQDWNAKPDHKKVEV